jgi:NADH dehydrogenase (ubiquinone) 1 beta subcomplex subunit 8
MWGPDIPNVPPRTALFQFTLATLAFVGFGFLAKAALVPDRPAVPRQYPFSGLVTELGGLEENKARVMVRIPRKEGIYIPCYLGQ